jgi:hypothetical protein
MAIGPFFIFLTSVKYQSQVIQSSSGSVKAEKENSLKQTQSTPSQHYSFVLSLIYM